jgi:ABC-type transporter Mla subunit MlaD
MTSPTPDPLATGLQLLIATRTGEQLQQLLTPDGQQSAVLAALAVQAQKIHNLEVQMSDTTDAIAELNTETDALAARIDAVLASIEGVDDATAAELRKVSARLKGLAADPANPVPPADEEPSPEPAPPTP